MVKSSENGTSLPPFLVKCYEMVNDESTNELISWTESNNSFIIWDESKFSSQLLPMYFKHSNFSSFVRQLNIYGFRKIDTDRWQFAHEAFIKGCKHLLKNIKRRKHPQTVLAHEDSPQTKVREPLPSYEDESRSKLWKEVENLKADKNALMLELKKLRQHQRTSRSKMLLLRQELKGMEKKQQQILSFLVMAMQNPDFMVQIFQLKENVLSMSETGANKLTDVTNDCEPTPTDGTVGAIAKYQPPIEEDSNYEDITELDFSADQMRDLLVDLDFLLDPAEGKLFSLEDNNQFVFPDMPENDAMLEELLSNSSIDNGQLES